MFIEKKLEDELSQISDYVSNNPLIAMAQINAAHQLFEKSVHSWKIIVKGIFINKFTVNKQQFIIKKLELLYHENFMAVINDIEPYACSFDVLQSMLSDHYLFVNSDMPAVNFFKKNEVDMKKSMPIVSLCGR